MIPPSVGPPTMYPDGMPATGEARQTRFPTWLKVISILLFIVKVLPLAAVVLLAAVLTGVSADIGPEWQDEIRSVGAVLVLLAAVPFLVLLLQLVATVMSRRVLLIIVAGLLAAIDVLLTIALLAAAGFEEGESGAVVVLATVAAFQVTLLVGAIRNR